MCNWKWISLTRGYRTKVDVKDYALLSKFKWAAFGKSPHVYARRNLPRQKDGRRPYVTIGQFLLGKIFGQVIDHVNGDTLDDRRFNLRSCKQRGNRYNSRKRKNSLSKFKGVTWDRRANKWKTSVTISLGSFDSEVFAAKAYDRYARENYGEFARLNFPKRR